MGEGVSFLYAAKLREYIHCLVTHNVAQCMQAYTITLVVSFKEGTEACLIYSLEEGSSKSS